MLYGKSFYKVKTDIIKFLIFSNDYQKRTYINPRNEEVKGVLLKVNEIKPHAIIYNFIE
jgi:hypothetical protein